MNKYLSATMIFRLALSLAALLTSSLTSAATLSDSIKDANYSGAFRFAYINSDPDVAGSQTTSAAAIGGHIKMTSKEWNRLQFAIAPYFSQKIGALSGDEDEGKLNGDFFDSNQNSFVYFGEAYLQYGFNGGRLRYGRQVITTPFINDDDLRMLKHTFEALWGNYQASENIFLEGGLVKRWAGLDHGGSQDVFERASGDGVLALGASLQMKTHHTFHLWYYDFDQSHSQIYADADYVNGNFAASVQYGNYSEENNSTIDGSFHGAMLSYAMKPLTFRVAYNKASNDAGKKLSAGLGVGNFYTTMDDSFIADKTDAEAYSVTIEYEINDAMRLLLGYGHFEDENQSSVDTDELNLIFSYAFAENADLEFIHVDIDNAASPTDTASNVSRQLLRINYAF